MGAGKVFLLIIALIVLALASFLGTIKILVPDYDFKSLLPEKAVSVFKNEEKTEAPTTQTTTKKAVPKREMLDYLEDNEFKFDEGKKGNFIGNLLNGGKVGEDGSYIYHIVDGKGIYRFAPGSESYSLYYKTDHKLCSLNLRGDYLYFVDETDSKLLKLQKGSSSPKTIAENAKFVYVYDSKVYFITNDNSLCLMNAKELIPTTLYYSADNDIQFVGISKKRVFFIVNDGDSPEFLTIDNEAKEKAAYFRESEPYKFALNYVMENGYLYYIERDTESGEGHFVVRQKFGSQNAVEIAKTKTNCCYPVVDKNRLFYAELSDNKLAVKEYNMNSKASKTMLKSDELEGSAIEDTVFFHGGEYDFIIGGGTYKASSNLTGSTNVMRFKNSGWSY